MNNAHGRFHKLWIRMEIIIFLFAKHTPIINSTSNFPLSMTIAKSHIRIIIIIIPTFYLKSNSIKNCKAYFKNKQSIQAFIFI